MAKREREESTPQVAANGHANGEAHGKVDAMVIGIGQLGLCFALTLEKSGLSVIGVDTRADFVQQINDRTFTSKEPGVTEQLQLATKFEATIDLVYAASRCDLIFILVPTPTSGNAERFYDHGMVSNVLAKLNEQRFAEKRNIVINATIMPGYINTIGKLLLKDCPKTTLSYNPAFVAQGDIMDGYRTGGWFGMVLIGGADQDVAQQLKAIYLKISGDVPVNVQIMSPESAEICKLASNCFRTTKISFANMVGDIADATVGANKDDICTALGADRSIGPLCMRPGYGYGGPCYPRDNQAFGVYAQSVGVKPTISLATDEYNNFHHDLMAERMRSSDAPVHIFEDVGYKPGIKVPMIDYSPKLAVAQRLAKQGARVIIRDRQDLVIAVMKEFGALFAYELVT